MDTQNWRQRIYSIIQKDEGTSRASKIYDIVMLVAIMSSLVPLTFSRPHIELRALELVTVSIFIVDYILRWITADYKLGKGAVSFLIYPFTFMAIVDQLSIIPAFTMMNKSFKLLRITRLLRIFRLLKFLRYTEKVHTLVVVIQKEKRVLVSVLFIAVAYVFITALFMFNMEPKINLATGEPTFRTFFDALYWATVTLTTVGYGDICPVTQIGRFVSMISSLFGVAIIALPSGIITAGYLEELRLEREERRQKQEEGEEKPSPTPDISS